MKTEFSSHPFPIVFFDGFCGLCNQFVLFLIRKDRSSLLKFAPLQGQTAALELPTHYQKDLKTLIYLDSTGLYEKSDAVIRILSGPIAENCVFWKFSILVKIFPLFFRDFIYDQVAQHRHKWLKNGEICELPNSDTARRFLP